MTQLPFSQSSYSVMLNDLRKAGYLFPTFSEYSHLSHCSKSVKYCLLRHDVDVSIDYALDMARLESSHGLRSTYFLMLRSPMYNLMSRHASAAIQLLLELGHDIGLHFDAGCPRRKNMSLVDDLKFELGVLGGLLGRSISAFSFHQPSQEVIQSRVELRGIINTYHPDHLPGYTYISDSNRSWRGMTPFELPSWCLDRVQLLIHPIWWMCESEHTSECWDRAVVRNFETMQNQLIETERAYGSSRILSIANES